MRRRGEGGRRYWGPYNGAKAELPETRDIVLKRSVGHNDAGADRAKEGKGTKVFLGKPDVKRGKVRAVGERVSMSDHNDPKEGSQADKQGPVSDAGEVTIAMRVNKN